MRFTGEYDTLIEQTLGRYQQEGFLVGDYVKIKKDFIQNESVKRMSTQMHSMIDAAIKSGLNLKIASIKSDRSEAVNGPVGAPNVPGMLWADVVVEYAPAMWKDPMTLPLSVLERIDRESAMSGHVPYTDNIKGPEGQQITPVEVKATNNHDEAVSANHNLSNKNSKLQHTPAPKDGLKQINASLERDDWKGDVQQLSEAYAAINRQANKPKEKTIAARQEKERKRIEKENVDETRDPTIQKDQNVDAYGKPIKEATGYEVELNALEEGLRELKGYLTSSKFHQDTTVQVADVLRRIEEIQHNAKNAGWAQHYPEDRT